MARHINDGAVRKNMAKIGVVQADLRRLGGGQIVCMNVLETLQSDHDVDVLTTGPTDIEELNGHAATDVHDVSCRTPGRIPRYASRYRGNRFVLFEVALLNRYVEAIADEYDLLISTVNELSLPGPSIQYVHVPQFDRPSVPGEEATDTPFYQMYRQLCAHTARFRDEYIQQGKLLANSEWTAGVTEDIYGTRPQVLYPPIDNQPVTQRPWGRREAGFVAVGRLDPTKNYERLIRIVDGVRNRGHETHLHIVGPADSTEYAERVQKLVDGREYVFYEGMVSRERMFELLSTHRYGLHGKDFEHFGMAVAEMVLAGMVPFVPKSGGQQEIVNNDGRLLYEDAKMGIEKVTSVLNDPNHQESIREALPDVEERFGQRRFQAKIDRVVEETLAKHRS